MLRSHTAKSGFLAYAAPINGILPGILPLHITPLFLFLAILYIVEPCFTVVFEPVFD